MKKFSVLFLILALAVLMVGTARATDPNLLNPGFEAVDQNDANLPEYWEFYVYDPEADGGTITYDTTGAGHNNSDSVKMHVPADSNYIELSCFQEMYAAERISYTLTGWARLKDTTPQGSRDSGCIKLEFKDKSGKVLREDVNDIFTLPYFDVWMQVTIDSNGVAPNGTRKIACTIVNKDPDLNTTIYYDDLDLTQTTGRALTDCEKAQFSADFPGISKGDINRDCLVDLRDIALLAKYWVRCNAVGCADDGYGW